MKCIQTLFAVIGTAGALSLSGLKYSVDNPPGNNKGPIKDGDVEFHFYTRENPLRPIVLPHEAEKWTIPDHFKPEEELVVIIHGFTGSANSTSVVLIRDAVLWSRSANVLLVQWENLALGPWYDEASSNVNRVAPLVAEGIRYFDRAAQQAGATPLIQNRTHIVGFSLGAQVAGLAGSNLHSQVARITGLDPAKPIFDQNADEDRLDPSDAQFVQVIHTAAGFLSFKEPLGHVDFYPNGGNDQPGCALSPSASLVCNHFRAYEYLVESLYEPKAFPAYKCDSWESFANKSCALNDVVYMSYSTPNTTRGHFYLRTNAQEPFGQGESKYVGFKTTTTTTTSTTTEKSRMDDPVKKWLDEKGHSSDVTQVDNNALVEGRSAKGNALSLRATHSLPVLVLLCVLPIIQ